MSLTERANRYLESLERRPAVSTERVQRAIEDQGVEPFDAWLTFQERYAGYVQPLGRDQAVWGLVHEKAKWMRPNAVVLEERVRNFWFAVCADVHPSYGFWLNCEGEITNGPASSVEVYIERLAVQWEFCGDSPRLPFIDYSVTDSSVLDHLADEGQRIEEASDHYMEYRMSGKRLGMYDHREKSWRQVYTRPK